MALLGRRQPFHQRRLSSLVYGAAFTAYTLSCAAGAYTVTGASAGLKAGHKVGASAGSYAVSGATAGLKTGHKVAATAGAYVYTGTAAGLKAGHKVGAGVGTYTYTGTAAGLKATRKGVSGSGAYVINGANATLTKYSPGARSIIAGQGDYTYTGTSVTLRKRQPHPSSGGAAVRTVFQAPIRTPVFNYQTPETDPSHYLFTRVWIAFLNAVQFVCNSATYLVGSVSLTGQTATINLTPIQVRSIAPLTGTTTLFPAGRYRISTSLRITTPASISSIIEIDFGWTSGGIAQSWFGVQNTSNLEDVLIADTFMIVIDDQTEIQYTIGTASVGTPLVYAADIAVESIAS